MNVKLKIWDTELKQMFEAATSVYGKLRYILNMPQQKGFNTLIEYKPSKERFIPLMFTGMLDKDGVELWEADKVKFKFDESDMAHLDGVIVYETENACFSVRFGEERNDIILMPLFALTPLVISTGKCIYEK